jgi:hypothetical protein
MVKQTNVGERELSVYQCSLLGFDWIRNRKRKSPSREREEDGRGKYAKQAKVCLCGLESDEGDIV